jgi:hypothetical protein
MPSTPLAAPVPHSLAWTGRVASALVVLFLVFDGVIHVLAPQPVVQAFAQLDVPVQLALGIGIIELVLTALYAIPRTAALGALLLTAYLGGATAIQLRAGAAPFPVIFPAMVGALVWGGLVLRDERLRSYIFRHAER